jgi:hypothetical protein
MTLRERPMCSNRIYRTMPIAFCRRVAFLPGAGLTLTEVLL